MRFKTITLLLLSTLLLISAGCGSKKEKEKMESKGETYRLPTGEVVKMLRVGEDKEKIEKVMTKTVTGRVEYVSNHPNPETLTRGQLGKSYMLTIQRKDGEEPILPSGELTAELRKYRGKTVTVVGVERRHMPTINGITYFIYELKEIKKVEE